MPCQKLSRREILPAGSLNHTLRKEVAAGSMTTRPKVVRAHVRVSDAPFLPFQFVASDTFDCHHAVTVVASSRSLALRRISWKKRMGIIYGSYSFNNMSTYEESCLPASRPSIHRRMPESQQEQYRKRHL